MSWFAAHHLPCPAHYNPADFFIDAVSLDYRTPKAEAASRRRLRALADSYRQQAEAGIQVGFSGVVGGSTVSLSRWQNVPSSR